MDNLQDHDAVNLHSLIDRLGLDPELFEQIVDIIINNPDILNGTYMNSTIFMHICHNACYDYNTNIYMELLFISVKYNLDINKIDDRQNSVLYYMMRRRYITRDNFCNIIKLLINHGADMNQISMNYRSILMELLYECPSNENNNKKIYDLIKYLLENTQIDLKMRDLINRTAYDIAVFRKYDKISELIKNYEDTSLDTKCALD